MGLGLILKRIERDLEMRLIFDSHGRARRRVRPRSIRDNCPIPSSKVRPARVVLRTEVYMRDLPSLVGMVADSTNSITNRQARFPQH